MKFYKEEVRQPRYSHPPHGGCGLKLILDKLDLSTKKSPSTRRVWIEIVAVDTNLVGALVTLHTEGVD